jgi:sugar lactone lactonase YvrE
MTGSRRNPSGPVATTAGQPPRPISPPGALLGESPVWDAAADQLLWVDLWGGTLHATDPATGLTETAEVGPPLSAVVPTTRGTRVVVSGLCILELSDHETRHLADVPEAPCMRANDAAVDPAGRLWVGTMTLPQRPYRPGGLWRLDTGARTPVRVVNDVALANGIAWSPPGDTLYFVDSLRQRVMAYPFDVDSGTLGTGGLFVDIPREGGMPDGITVDRDGAVWVVLAGGGTARRYSASGALEERLTLPTRYPTSCAFGGAALEDLFITTGCRPAPAGDRPAEVARGAGALFAASVTTGGLPASQMEV